MTFIKHLIAHDIWQYEFKEDETSYVITALIDEKSALLIDTGYERHIDAVIEALLADGIVPVIQVISHYHPDHCGGLHRMIGLRIIASHQYESNYNNCRLWCPDLALPHPTDTAEGAYHLRFGKRELTCSDMGGHTTGHLVTSIDNRYLHVGDLVMRTSCGHLSLPYICEDGHLGLHCDSVERIKTMALDGLLLAHGAPLLNSDETQGHLSELLYYLKALEAGRETDDVRDYLPHRAKAYGFLRFHENNLKRRNCNN